jgi:hypothetical protein
MMRSPAPDVCGSLTIAFTTMRRLAMAKIPGTMG